MNTPFFSVIIPVFNKEKHLAKTVESVLQQAFGDFELLLVLDPSTDGSNAMAESFADPRIRLFYRNEPGPGGYAARNLGVEKARAEWICFLDADDWWSVNHLSLLHQTIFSYPSYKIFITGFSIIREGEVRANRYMMRHAGRSPFIMDLPTYLLSRPMSTINFAVDRKAIKTAGLFPEKMVKRGGDHDTWLRLWWQERQGIYIPVSTAFYNQDVADSVIRLNDVHINDHPVVQRVKGFLTKPLDNNLQTALKRYANNSILAGLKQRAKTGRLRPHHMSAIYAEVMHPGFYRRLQRISFLPGFLQRFLVHYFLKKLP